MFTRSFRYALPLAAALSVAVWTGPAQASTDVRSARVAYADLNLSHDTGVKTLYARVRRAARSVCDSPHSSSRQLRAAAENCVDQAIQRAVEEIDLAALTAHDLDRRGVRHLSAR